MGTWIVGALVLAVIALAARKVINDRKAGNCCGDCHGCDGCPKGQ